MSRTYDIACVECGEALWIAQGWIKPGLTLEEIEAATGHIYTTPDHIRRLRLFLFFHMGHCLVFEDDERLGVDDYRDFQDRLGESDDC